MARGWTREASAAWMLARADQLDPSSIVALSSRGWFAINWRRDDLALVEFERVVELDPAHGQGHLQPARSYWRASDVSRVGDH